MDTVKKDFKALHSVGETFSGQEVRGWIERNMHREMEKLIGEHSEVATRHLQGRVQALREILLDWDSSSDIVRRG
jgi:hypothetical protein